ncbi:MAG: hypothetical protein GF411_03785, partial [Candidatus Lokiarchaeota archaeon]|nr:hypothetical protein [Candidatus Lokiarchaeota archaeon]
MKRIASLLFLSVLVFSVMYNLMHTTTPITNSKESAILNPLTDNIDSFLPLDKSVRVAIYNEPNTTLPDYATGLGMKFSNEISSLITNFEDAGFDVTTLTVHDIADHKLKTADYDVFILADNYPRENITDYVKEFWLGGGGVLAFNAAIGYLVYNGILFPGETGDDGYGAIWDEETWSDHIISERHPVTKEYQENNTVNEHTQDEKEFFNGQFIVDNSILGPYTTILANQTSGNELASIIAIENVELGGRIVTMAANTSSISSDITPIIHDSLEWLCPKPKGRVLFDLAHDAYYGVDPWDDQVISLAPRYQEWRNILVNHTFLFDKLWPSAEGNLTTENLEKYDMLITVLPDINFTASEVTQVTDWVNNGGNLLVLGDKYTFTTEQQNLNFLMKEYHIEYNTTHSTSGTVNDLRLHPLTENITEIAPAGPGIVNIQSPAEPIAVTDTGEIVVAAEEYGNGRVVYISDINIFDYLRIVEYVNQEFALNIANWLTSNNADILIFSDGGGVFFDPDWNYYKSPVARAITSLGIRYHLTFKNSYFNLSLNLYQYDLIVIDSNYYNIVSSYSTEVIDYLEEGGKLAIRSWVMSSNKSLWSYIGIAPNGTTITSGPPDVYLWDTDHPIFTTPNTYGDTVISETNEIFGTDYAFIKPLENATALAGVTVSEEEFAAAITINEDETVIANSFSITQYLSDTDNSTYDDGFEIWMNEIAYLLKPTIDHPADLEMEA